MCRKWFVTENARLTKNIMLAIKSHTQLWIFKLWSSDLWDCAVKWLDTNISETLLPLSSPWRWKQHITTQLHIVTTLKTTIWITVVKIQSLTTMNIFLHILTYLSITKPIIYYNRIPHTATAALVKVC